MIIVGIVAVIIIGFAFQNEEDTKDDELTDEPLVDPNLGILKIHHEENPDGIPDWAYRKIINGQLISYADLLKFKPEQLDTYFKERCFYMSPARQSAYFDFGIRNSTEMMLYHKMKSVLQHHKYRQEKEELLKETQPTDEQLGKRLSDSYGEYSVRENEYEFEPQYLRDRITKEEYNKYRIMREWGERQAEEAEYRRLHPTEKQLQQKAELDRMLAETERQNIQERQLEELQRIRENLENY